MALYSLGGALLFLLVTISCGRGGPLSPAYRPVLPEVPPLWIEILGEPHWYLEWVGEAGQWQDQHLGPAQGVPQIHLHQEWTVPLIAWPHWPQRGLLPGMMKPAGALFPWDAQGGDLLLSWEGGAHALFWRELSAAPRPNLASQGRLPWRFDWPRFRELMEGPLIHPAVRQDPHLADWADIAQRTVLMGFDRRRIRPMAQTDHLIPGLGGLWVSSSPFADYLHEEIGAPIIISGRAPVETWVSALGFIRASREGWVFVPWGTL
ncbi:MAG: hypothetical protein FWH12_08535 [Treponema sp.]|nr:hypothetical protein [Treponema sp.]